RAGELARFGDEVVVGVDLVLDLLVAQHPLGACHLLDLPAHRVGVLEHDRHERSDRDAARLLQLDDAAAEFGTFAFPGAHVDDVFDGELAHVIPRCRYTRSRSSRVAADVPNAGPSGSSRYRARARPGHARLSMWPRKRAHRPFSAPA